MADQLQAIVQRMIDAGESEANIGAVIREYKAAPVQPTSSVTPARGSTFEEMQQANMQDALANIPRGIVDNVKSFVPRAAGALGAIGSEIGNTLVDSGNLIMHPGEAPDAIARGWENAKAMPGQAYDAVAGGVRHFLQTAHDNPGEFGAQVGGVMGDTAMGGAISTALPLALAPVAARTGAIIADTGRIAKWPMRIAGAHAVLGGNPAGFMMAAAPPLMEKYGTDLQRFGTLPGAAMATPEGIALNLENDIRTGARPSAEILTDIRAKQAALVDARQGAKLPVDRDLLTKQIDRLDGLASQAMADAKAANPQGTIRLAGKYQDQFDNAMQKRNVSFFDEQQTAKAAAQKVTDNAARLQTIEEAKAGLEPGKPSVSQSTSAVGPDGQRLSVSQSFKQPTPPPGDDPTTAMLKAIADNNAAMASRGGPVTFRTAAPTTIPPVNADVDAAVARGRNFRSGPTQDELEQADFVARMKARQAQPPTPPPPTDPAAGMSPTRQDELLSKLGGQQGIRIGGNGRAPIAPLTDAPVTADVLDQIGHATTPDTTPFKGTRSKNKGVFSVNDGPRLVRLGRDNPDASMDDIAALLEKEKADASATIRTNAGLDAGARKAAQLDN